MFSLPALENAILSGEQLKRKTLHRSGILTSQT